MVALSTSALQASLSARPQVSDLCALSHLCALNKVQTQDPASRPEGDERHVWPADIKSRHQSVTPLMIYNTCLALNICRA